MSTNNQSGAINRPWPEITTSDPRRARLFSATEWLALGAAMVMHALLAGWAASIVNTQFDENTDLLIASGLREAPFSGNGVDPLNARLPMYLTAVASALTRMSEPIQIRDLSRALSILVGAASVLLVGVLGRRWWSARAGLIAAWLLAVSPYFLSCESLAMSQADAFCPATMLLALLVWDRYRITRDPFSCVLLGVSVGVAIGAKFTGVFLLPALFLAEIPSPNASRRSRWVVDGSWWRWGIASMALALSAVFWSQVEEPLQTRVAWTSILCSIAGLVCYWGSWGTLLGAVHFARHERSVEAPWRTRWLGVIAITIASSLVLFPAHVFDVAIMREALQVAWSWEHGGSPQPGVSFRLLAGQVLLKLGLPFGLATVAALAWGAQTAFSPRGRFWKFSSRSDLEGIANDFDPSREGLDAAPTASKPSSTVHERSQVIREIPSALPTRAAALTLLIWTALLLGRPVVLPYYLVAVYPLLVLLLGAFLDWALAFDWEPIRLLARAYVLVATIWLAIGLLACAPMYWHYGYETVGERWLNHPSRSINGIVSMNWDGIEEALDWCQTTVPEGAPLAICIYDDASASNYLKGKETRFLPAYLRHGSLDKKSAREFAFVVVQPDTPIYPGFFNDFELARPFERGRGVYRTLVASVYRRRAGGPTPVGSSGVANVMVEGGSPPNARAADGSSASNEGRRVISPAPTQHE